MRDDLSNRLASSITVASGSEAQLSSKSPSGCCVDIGIDLSNMMPPVSSPSSLSVLINTPIHLAQVARLPLLHACSASNARC